MCPTRFQSLIVRVSRGDSIRCTDSYCALYRQRSKTRAKMPRATRARPPRLAPSPERSPVAPRLRRRAGLRSRSRKSLTTPSSSIRRHTRESSRMHPSSSRSPCLSWSTSSRWTALSPERSSEISQPRVSSDRSVITTLLSLSTLARRQSSPRRSNDDLARVTRSQS